MMHDWIDYVNTFGVVGVLVGSVFAFYTGRVLPKKVVDKMLRVYSKQLASQTEEIINKLDEVLLAVKESNK